MVYRPSVPLTFTQTHNWWFSDARSRGAEFLIWMHNDAESTDYAHLKLRDFALKETRKWGTIFTNYDAIAAVNLDAIDDVGGYDTVFPKYLCDCDLHYRMKLRGWQTLDSGIHTLHHGSQHIKSDPQLRFTNDIVHRLDAQYYRQKWGGDPGRETFTTPFDRPDIFPDLKPVGVW